MHFKYPNLHIDLAKWNGTSDEEKVREIKRVSELVTYNGFTKDDIIFLLKETVRIATKDAAEE